MVNFDWLKAKDKETRETGTLVFYDPKRHFGFIKGDNGTDYYVSSNDFARVTFTIGKDTIGREKAIDVEILKEQKQ